MLHLLFQLLLRKHAHSLVNPKKPFETVLIIVYHVFIPILLNCQLFTQSEIYLTHGFVEILKHFLQSLFYCWNNLATHGFTKLLND